VGRLGRLAVLAQVYLEARLAGCFEIAPDVGLGAVEIGEVVFVSQLS
jgi:hypothetical protein